MEYIEDTNQSVKFVNDNNLSPTLPQILVTEMTSNIAEILNYDEIVEKFVNK